MPLKTLPPPSNIKCYIWLINDNPAPSFLEKGNQRTLPHFPITKSTNLPVSLASSTDELSLQCPYCSAYILISFISPQLVASEMSTITEYHCFSLLTTSVLAHKPLHSQLLHTPTPPFLWHAPPHSFSWASTTPFSLCLFLKDLLYYIYSCMGLGEGATTHTTECMWRSEVTYRS